MTHKEIVALVAIASASYPSMQNKNPDPIITAWETMLADIPFELAKSAIVKVCRGSEFFPSVAQIVAASKELDPRTMNEPTAEEAWGEVTSEMQRAGHNLPTRFSTDTVRRAVDAMGWMNLCMSENVMADRAHFLRIYGAMKNAGHRRDENERCLQISGVGEMVKMLAQRMSN